ncbi:MAG TPA: amidohydrolase family protein [Candidatus Aphodomonas merdavium]|nr:amidohydrolase family protein [Candidatus Aphodomonas merdavium]
MIIDFHTHTFPDRIAPATIEKLSHLSHAAAFSDGTEGGLKASMARAGIDLSIVLPVATNPLKVEHINDASARLSGADGLLSFGCMHPDFPGWHGELSRIARLGLKGIKLHPVYQDVDFDDPRYLRILERCGELGLIVVTHAGQDIGFPGKVRCSPEMVLRAVRQVGPVTLVLAHMGGWRDWPDVERLLPQTSVCLDTAFSLGKITPLAGDDAPPENLALLDSLSFMRMVRAFGAERILFATDSPWSDQQQALAAIRALPLTPQEQAAILSKNACRLLKLPQAPSDSL